MATKNKSKSSEKGIDSRKLALSILIKIEKKNAYANIVLASALDNCSLSTRDKAFVTLLVQGVTRNKKLLDSTISQYSKKPIEKMSTVLINVLRLGIFQLDFVQDIPPPAVLNTSTAIARLCGHEGLAKYTNGVLRSYLRSKNNQSEETSSDQESDLSLEQLAINFSTPEWLVRRWLNNFGREATLKLLKHSVSQPDTFIRTNAIAISNQGLVSIMGQEEVDLEKSKFLESCYRLRSRPRGRIEDLGSYKEGLFSIQDEAAQLVSLVVAPKSGELVIDLCAAPGGKTLHMAELMENSGKIIAVDKYENRLAQLKKGRKRLGVSNVEIQCADGREFTWSELADRVLIDAPCTGTGVLNRKADIRHKREESDLQKLQKLQLELLTHAASLVKPGGIVVYATCSLENEENLEVVEKFLAENKDHFSLDDLTAYLPSRLKEIEALSATLKKGYISLTPAIENMSGFFIARIKKDVE